MGNKSSGGATTTIISKLSTPRRDDYYLFESFRVQIAMVVQ
jgi:hypothetical protein